MKTNLKALALCFGLGFPLSSWAQAAVTVYTPSQVHEASPFEQGISAFREGAFEKAATFFASVEKNDPQYAESQFMLARIYTETPLKNGKKANQYIRNALLVKPSELRYLVAQLELLRSPSNNFIQERLKDAQRRDLARKILKLDDKNAFAHEEVGMTYIADYWRFRNAIAIPEFASGRTNRISDRRNLPQSEAERRQYLDGGVEGNATNPNNTNTSGSTVAVLQQIDNSDPFGNLARMNASRDIFGINSVTMTDQFDLEAMQQQGLNANDLRGRGELAYKQAVKHLKLSLEADPMRRSAYDQMMKVYMLKGDFTAAAALLNDMVTFFGDDAMIYLYIGATNYKLGNLEAATEAFDKAFRFMDAPLKNAFTDIGLILPLDELPKYKADPINYSTKFWTSQTPRFLTPWNERKLEHYFRLVYADLLYSAPKLEKRGWETQRGQILIRYGIPQADIVLEKSGAIGGRASDAYDERYGTDDRSGILSSNQRNELILDEIFDAQKSAKLYNVWVYGKFKFVFEDTFRNGEYQFYSPSPEDIDYGVDPYQNDYELKSKEIFREYAEVYDYKAFGRQVSLPYLVNTFKGKGSQADVYVHAGIPVQNYDSNKTQIDLNLNVGTFLIGSNREFLVERRQTMYGMKTAQVVPFKESKLWLTTQTMSAPSGPQTLSVEFETATGGTVGVQRRGIAVPDYTKDQFMLSDVMLAYNVSESPDGKPIMAGDVVRKDLSIRPAPWSVFGKDKPIYLYFELYNLTVTGDGKTKYQVEASLTPKNTETGVRRLFNRKQKGVAIRFDNAGTTPDDGQYLVLDANDQLEGLYTLVVRVKDINSGKTVEKTKDLYLE